MTTTARTLAALALAWAAALGPMASPGRADDEGQDLASKVRAFHAAQLREYDQAIAELRDLIDERARALAAMDAELRDARKELDALVAFRDREQADPAVAPASAPRAIVGLPGGVIPASAVAAGDGGWQGVVRLSATPDGRIAILHESGDGRGVVQAGALQADQVELRVTSPDDARILAHALRADGKPVVTWPDLRIAPDLPPSPDRLGAMERSIERLADAVDRIERRTEPPASPPEPDAPVAVEPPAEIPPAPEIPD